MAKNVPEQNIPVSALKAPKAYENPAIYKEFPVAWQLSFIDDESRWGTKCLREHYSLGSLEEIVSELPENIHNDLFDAVDELIGKRFDSISEIMLALITKSNNNISAAEQQIIFKYMNENPFWSEIYSKIRHFETTSWHVIEKELFGNRKRKTKHHSISVSKIIPEAQKRLEKLKRDDIDELFSIRLNGKLRIWGIRKYAYFQVLWFDFNHEICPSIPN